MTNDIFMDLILPILLAFIAASGFWTFIMYLITRKDTKKNATTQLMLGLANREILRACFEYKERDYIYKDEYKDLMAYLWEPYHQLGGNGTVEKAISDVNKLELRERD